MSRPSAADDFLTIRARTHKLRRENPLHAADDFATRTAPGEGRGLYDTGLQIPAILFEISK